MKSAAHYMSDEPLLSPAVRALAEARGLTKACEMFPADVARAAEHAAKPLPDPDLSSSGEPALRFDPARIDGRFEPSA
jgi:hypothetical protein